MQALLLLLLLHALAVASLGRRGAGGVFPAQSAAHPSTANCTMSWFNQTLDHFSWAAPDGRTTYRQRYFEYDGYYEAGGPIWFYCGNEASVELYVNATGLMWENAARFGALLVFAEHRYYGESQPFLPIDGSGNWKAQPLQYLTHEQAIADYAVLIDYIRSVRGIADRSTAVIAFGGSYGGMLAAWIRMKYPGTVDGAIAASAPILGFEGQTPAYDTNSYWQVVTRDATPAAGANAACAANVLATWPVMFALGRSEKGRETLRRAMGVCPPALAEEGGAHSVAMLSLNAWDTLSMGNFPYPSNYLVFQETHDASVLLPAWPVRVACDRMTRDTALNDRVAAIAAGGGAPPLSAAEQGALLARMLDATNVLNNASGAATCFPQVRVAARCVAFVDISPICDLLRVLTNTLTMPPPPHPVPYARAPQPTDDEFDGIWDYQYCTEMLPQEVRRCARFVSHCYPTSRAAHRWHSRACVAHALTPPCPPFHPPPRHATVCVMGTRDETKHLRCTFVMQIRFVCFLAPNRRTSRSMDIATCSGRLRSTGPFFISFVCSHIVCSSVCLLILYSFVWTSDTWWYSTFIDAHCAAHVGVTPRREWITRSYGGRAVAGAATGGVSNIVFSNGLLDPWSSAGVVENMSESVVAVLIEEGAHHLDLFFSNAADPPSVTNAREVELAHIAQWVAQKKEAWSASGEL
jgi:lysosomal Pro-X carboxypeptidase